MRKFLQCCIITFLYVSTHVTAQEGFSDRAKKYVGEYASLAMYEQRKNGIPAAVTLGQGILETEAGSSELMTEANNHFGIKCKNGWSGETYTHTDDAPDECFKKYKCAAESYRDHSEHLKRNQRYSVLFKLKEEDYKSWAVCLKKCGYATNPQYAQRLIKIIEDYNLQQYTLSAFENVSDVPVEPVVNAAPPMDTPKKQVAKPALQPRAFSGSHGDTTVMVVNKQHIVKAGETLASIAHVEAVDMNTLMRLNMLFRGEEPVVGAVLELQTMAKQKPAVRVTAIQAHNTNAIVSDDKMQGGDYIAIDRTKKTTPQATKTTTVNPVVAKAPEKPKPIIIIEEPNKRPVREPERPDPDDPKVKKEMEFTVLKAELDKVVYADDSKLIAENAPPPAPEKRPVAERPMPAAAKTAKYYTVKKGDTAFSIAKKNGITLEQLTEWNKLDGGVKIGQTLQVKE